MAGTPDVLGADSVRRHPAAEVHMCYFYKRVPGKDDGIGECPTRCFDVPCDPQFFQGWMRCRSGLHTLSRHIEDDLKSQLVMHGIRVRKLPDR